MLADNLKVLQASSFSLYLKAAGFHWNVEGANFPQYHEFLGDYYSDIYDTIDKIAEYIRALDQYAPASFVRFQELTQIADQVSQLQSTEQFMELLDNNATLLNLLNETFAVANAENQQGIANFMAERIDAMQKHNWMIRSILKSNKV